MFFPFCRSGTLNDKGYGNDHTMMCESKKQAQGPGAINASGFFRLGSDISLWR